MVRFCLLCIPTAYSSHNLYYVKYDMDSAVPASPVAQSCGGPFGEVKVVT